VNPEKARTPETKIKKPRVCGFQLAPEGARASGPSQFQQLPVEPGNFAEYSLAHDVDVFVFESSERMSLLLISFSSGLRRVRKIK